MSLGGWIIALAIGLALVLVAPHVPSPPAAKITKIIGIILVVVGAVLFVVWLVNVLTGTAVSAAPLAV